MKLMYALELSSLPEPPRSQLLIALAALTGFERWDQMRRCHGLTIEAAQAVGGLRSTGCCRRPDDFRSARPRYRWASPAQCDSAARPAAVSPGVRAVVVVSDFL
jgi:hypothetical protein